MLLAIDVGNSNIVFGLFEGDELAASWRVATDIGSTADEYAVLFEKLLAGQAAVPSDVDGICISSVVPSLTVALEHMAWQHFLVDPVVVSADLQTGIRLSVDNPRAVGADRLVNALAVSRLHPTPGIIVDFGTATTVDAVSSDGELLGGAIVPGLQTAADGLFRGAARLFAVELTGPASVVGRDTTASLQSGTVYGYVGLIEGLVERINRELGSRAWVIGTGGLAPVVAPHTSVIDIIDPDLTLQGLRLFYRLNSPADPARVVPAV